LIPGKKAPAFTLKDQNGATHSLSDYAGRPVVLYFYPKDDTPAARRNRAPFQDNLPKFKPSKAVILGASILDEKSKAKFASKYKLTFPLLADADHAIAREVRRVAGEVTLRPHVYGDCPHDLPHRSGRQGRAPLGQRQGRTPRGRRTVSSERARVGPADRVRQRQLRVSATFNVIVALAADEHVL
jgi:peroxiredoxin